MVAGQDNMGESWQEGVQTFMLYLQYNGILFHL